MFTQLNIFNYGIKKLAKEAPVSFFDGFSPAALLDASLGGSVDAKSCNIGLQLDRNPKRRLKSSALQAQQLLLPLASPSTMWPSCSPAAKRRRKR